MGESPLIQLDPEEAALEVRPRGADGSSVAEPEASWADQVALEEAAGMLALASSE